MSGYFSLAYCFQGSWIGISFLSKNTIKKIKNTIQIHRLGDNICNHIADKDLISSIYKELLQLNNKKRKTQLKDGQRTQVDISPKTIDKWPANTLEDS